MLKYLFAIPTILISYLVVVAVKISYTLFHSSSDNSIYWIGPIALIIYCLLSYFAYRKNKIASWLIILLIFACGIGLLIIGIIMVPISQIFFKIISIVFGIYFVLGSYKILCSI